MDARPSCPLAPSPPLFITSLRSLHYGETWGTFVSDAPHRTTAATHCCHVNKTSAVRLQLVPRFVFLLFGKHIRTIYYDLEFFFFFLIILFFLHYFMNWFADEWLRNWISFGHKYSTLSIYISLYVFACLKVNISVFPTPVLKPFNQSLLTNTKERNISSTSVSQQVIEVKTAVFQGSRTLSQAHMMCSAYMKWQCFPEIVQTTTTRTTFPGKKAAALTVWNNTLYGWLWKIYLQKKQMNLARSLPPLDKSDTVKGPFSLCVCVVFFV